MAANDFFSRWAKKNPATSEEPASRNEAPQVPADPAAQGTDEPAQPKPLPTLDDVEQLTPQSDYTAYMAKGVDENVRRSAMKKLFTDPHFNIMDGLDIYIDDYTKPDPIPPEMLAMLEHAKSVLNPLQHLESSSMRMIGAADEAASVGQDAPDPGTTRTDDEGEAPPEAEATARPETTDATDEALEAASGDAASPDVSGQAASVSSQIDQSAAKPDSDPDLLKPFQANDPQFRQS